MTARLPRRATSLLALLLLGCGDRIPTDPFALCQELVVRSAEARKCRDHPPSCLVVGCLGAEPPYGEPCDLPQAVVLATEDAIEEVEEACRADHGADAWTAIASDEECAADWAVDPPESELAASVDLWVHCGS